MEGKKFKHKPISFNSNVVQRSHNPSRFKDKDEEQTETRPNFISHLQPEILPLELMKTLLITRGGGDDVRNEESLERIISLFYKYITPKPQRLYKQNRRGKELAKNRKRRNDVHIEDDQDYKIMESDTKKAAKLTLIKSSDSSVLKSDEDQSRLKRPISCIDPERKKIKLSSPSSSTSSSLDRVKIIDKGNESKTSSENKATAVDKKKDDDVIIIEEVSQSKASGNSKATEVDKKEDTATKSDSQSSVSVGHKKIKLNRNHSSESKTNSKLEVATPEKSQISWP